MQKVHFLPFICSAFLFSALIVNSMMTSQSFAADDFNLTSKSQPTLSQHPPTATAGEDKTVKEFEKVTLDGSRSSDPDGDSLKYNWKLISPKKVTLDLGKTDKSSITFNVPPVGEKPRLILLFQLTVSDGVFLSRDFVKVTVTGDFTPGKPAKNVKTVTVTDEGNPPGKFAATDICGDGSYAYSFLTSGVKWKTFPVTFAIDATNSHMDINQAKNAIRQVFAVYDARISPGITNFRESSTYSSAQIKVSWRFMDGQYGRLGFTSYSYRLDTKAMISASVTFDSGDRYFVSSIDRCSGFGSIFDLQNIATHEVGHAMNLGHVSDRLQSMYPTSYAGETLKRSLGNGDKLGIKILYG